MVVGPIKHWSEGFTNDIAKYVGRAESAYRSRAVRVDTRIVSYANKVVGATKKQVSARVRLAAQLLRDKVVANLSYPVRKYRRKTKRRVWREVRQKSGKLKKPPKSFAKNQSYKEIRGTHMWALHDLKVRTITVVDPKSRSRRGQFPHADTTMLMKSIFYKMETPTTAIIGTPLDYGLILETRMHRSFLVRTLNETLPALRQIITAKMTLP